MTTITSSELTTATNLAGQFYESKRSALLAWATKQGRLLFLARGSMSRYYHMPAVGAVLADLPVDGVTVLEVTRSAKPEAGQIHVSALP